LTKPVLTALGGLLLAGFVWACLDAGKADDPAPGGGGDTVSPFQFQPGELAGREKWEKFLETAEVLASRQMVGPEAVTSPWVLTLKLGDVEHRALWKDPQGRMGGFWEGWQYEIAAYRIDKLIGLGLVPPTVERRFQGDRGSCQLWIEDTITQKEREEKGLKVPPAKVGGWNRATYLQRLFDNLIANEDRHAKQILITKDWRMVLIDHSRSFRTSGKFTKGLIFSARSPEGPRLMSELPRAVFERVKALDEASIRAAVGEYLSNEEIAAVLIRRDLVLAEIARLVKVNGEAKVLY
jgi:hypothetical protein